MASISKTCPVLPAPDTSATARWYAEKLGFQVRLDMENYAIVERDGAELHFWTSDSRELAENSSAYVRSDDVDALYEDMTGANAGGRIQAPHDREWGMREFYVWDPNGNLLRFGQPIAAAGLE